MQKIILISFIILIGGGIAGLLFFRGNEDSWICDNGTWVKHGNPSSPMPEEACGENLDSSKPSESTEETKSENKDDASVPPLTKETFIRIYFRLINDKEYTSALKYLAANQTSDEEWVTQYKAIKSVNVQNVEKYQTDETTYDAYKVTLDVVMEPDSVNAPIPYYGWGENPNIRFVTVVTENGKWKIGGIGTGP